MSAGRRLLRDNQVWIGPVFLSPTQQVISSEESFHIHKTNLTSFADINCNVVNLKKLRHLVSVFSMTDTETAASDLQQMCRLLPGNQFGLLDCNQIYTDLSLHCSRK